MKEIDRGSIRTVKLAVFFGTLAVLCVIGILLPRPAESEIEKRRLTEFPAFSWASFWDGSWFSGIDKWYADTYPLRETLIAGNKAVQGLYGIRTEYIKHNVYALKLTACISVGMVNFFLFTVKNSVVTIVNHGIRCIIKIYFHTNGRFFSSDKRTTNAFLTTVAILNHCFSLFIYCHAFHLLSLVWHTGSSA